MLLRQNWHHHILAIIITRFFVDHSYQIQGYYEHVFKKQHMSYINTSWFPPFFFSYRLNLINDDNISQYYRNEKMLSLFMWKREVEIYSGPTRRCRKIKTIKCFPTVFTNRWSSKRWINVCRNLARESVLKLVLMELLCQGWVNLRIESIAICYESKVMLMKSDWKRQKLGFLFLADFVYAKNFCRHREH